MKVDFYSNLSFSDKYDHDLGAGCIRVFNTEEGLFILGGIRFGGFLKVATGGTVDKDDKTLWQTVDREAGIEETMGKLPFNEPIIHENTYTYRNEKKNSDGSYRGKGGKPIVYHTCVVTENRKHDELVETIKWLNEQAKVHFDVGCYFMGRKFKKLNYGEIVKNNEELLSRAEKLEFKLLPVVEQQLKAEMNDKNNVIEQEYIQEWVDKTDALKYSEYEKFYLVPLKNYLKVLKSVDSDNWDEVKKLKFKTDDENFYTMFPPEHGASYYLLEKY